jgi:hypothetical protein
MRDKRFIIVNLIFAFFAIGVFCSESVDSISLESMLSNYIAQDSQIKNLALKYQQTLLSQKKSDVQNGFNVKLSTGQISVRTDVFNMEPSLELSFPNLNGTRFLAKVPINFSKKDDKSSLSGVDIGVKTEIWGNTKSNLELSEKRTERSVILAKRALENQILNIEIEFYKTLKSIYSNYSSLLSSENSLYEEKIDLELLQTQGYSANSVKYRIAQLEFGDVQRDVEQKKRDLEQSIVEFSSKCGLQNPLQLSLLANVEFAFVDEDFASLYPMQKFDDVEQAEWDLNMLQSQILAEKAFNIYMDANYILNDSSYNNADTVKTGVSLSGKGAELSAGVKIPIFKEEKNVSTQLLLTWNPTDLKTEKIENQNTDLDLQMAVLRCENAKTSYQEMIEDAILTKENLLWQQKMNLEEKVLYQELADDMETWFKRGYATDSENRMSQVKLQNALIQCKINEIDLLLNDLQTKIRFVREE